MPAALSASTSAAATPPVTPKSRSVSFAPSLDSPSAGSHPSQPPTPSTPARRWRLSRTLSRHDTSSFAQNRAFVFVKPHAMTKEVQDFVRRRLKERAVVVAREGRIEADAIERDMLVDKHYYAIASKATLLKPDKLPVPEAKFRETFGLDWAEALARGVALNAREACDRFGVDAEGLYRMWVQAEDEGQCVKLGGGFYCARIEPPGLGAFFVLNGFFMKMRSQYVAPGAAIYYFLAEWSPMDLSWADFRAKVLGPTDPSAAPADSVRGAIFAKWRDMGLKSEPTISDNGVHASASPIEALFERMNWLGAAVEDDPYGRVLLDRDVTPRLLEEWRRDPQVSHGHGRHRTRSSLYDVLEDLDADRCTTKCQDIAANGHTHATVFKNRAFVFIKPHAINRKVKAFVRDFLEDRGVRVIQEGVIEAERIDQEMMVDKHYYSIASKATLLTPEKLPVPRDKFEAAFGVDFEDTLVAGRALNAKDACDRLGLSASELGARWADAKRAGRLAKFAGGFYCARLEMPEQGTYYVFNGFFMEMREKFVKRGAEIHYFLAEWDPVGLSWAEFRGALLGPTDPATAPADSIRGTILRDWQALGLRKEPNITDNGVHASPSPIQALFERMNWLGTAVDKDPFGAQLLEAGISKELIDEWSKDPQVCHGYGRTTTSFYDFMEDKDSNVCLQECEVVAKAGHTPAIVKNTALVWLKPHAITEKAKDLVRSHLVSKEVSILKEGLIEAATIDRDMLIDNHFHAIASKAMTVAPDQLPVPKDRFLKAFGVEWEDVLRDGRALNAKEACARMKLDAAGLGAAWNQAKKQGQFVKFGGGFYCAKLDIALESEGRCSFYVVNGFFPEMRGKYVAPGAAVYYYLAEWDPLDLSWADFRGSVLGPTDPAAAPEDSLRGLIHSQWRELGLPRVPDISDNGLHASASPFEALSERMNWLAAKAEEDDFGQLLLHGGVTLRHIQEWALDPQVTFAKHQRMVTCSLYDALEDLDADRCVTQCQLIVSGGAGPGGAGRSELTGDEARELQRQGKTLKTVSSESYDAYAFKYYVRDPAAAEVWEVVRRQLRLDDGMYGQPEWSARRLSTAEVQQVLGRLVH